MNNDERRKAAIKRVRAKRSFRSHLVTYVVINAFLVGIWALSGAGSFWPGWVLLGWGVGFAFHGWNVYREEAPITNEEIRREMNDSG
ncbi:MAG: 2TM domain-containing protein [Acidimicrobiia bacterium]